MDGGRVTFESGYARVVADLARQALAVAFDAAPHRARQGERRWPMAEALPAARVLADAADDADVAQLAVAAEQLNQALSDPAGKVTDGFGHARPVYRWFALHLLGTAARLAGHAAAIQHLQQSAERLLARPVGDDRDPRLDIWRDAIAWQHGIARSRAAQIEPADEPAPLAPLGLDDLIDAWTYNELIGLHGLHLLALLRRDADAQTRARSAALYHLGHTQPDYTTYQPWGLAAFASDARTAVFAEQQLHDVATHLSIEGPGGAVLPALLLADAASALAGGLAGAWPDR
ncbi:MAG: hypothetical protein ACE37H_13880 [Phycisphaeraceae bacterium]